MRLDLSGIYVQFEPSSFSLPLSMETNLGLNALKFLAQSKDSDSSACRPSGRFPPPPGTIILDGQGATGRQAVLATPCIFGRSRMNRVGWLHPNRLALPGFANVRGPSLRLHQKYPFLPGSLPLIMIRLEESQLM